jgi:two-component system LytT family sensor kinase
MNRIKKRQLAEIAIHILFWIAVFYAVNASTSSAITVRISSNNNDTVMERKEVHAFLPAAYITLVLLGVLFYGNILWLFKKILTFRSNFVRFAIAACWFLLIFEIDNAAINLLTPRDPVKFGRPPTHRLDTAFKLKGGPPGPPPFQATSRIISDDGHPHFIMDMIDRSQLILLLLFLGILGISIAYFFLKEWAKADVLRVKLEANQLSTEVKFLRSQINPHFLFNTLNNLFSMAQGKGNDDLADGISKLSGMMRYMIYDSNADLVPLGKEIAYLEDCITLNKLRYADDEAKVIFDYPAQTEGVLVAPMLFISFVENAFKHGVIIGRSSEINISISMVNKQLVFSCQNTIYHIKKMEDEKGGIGLENVKRRLELVYPGKYELFIKNADKMYIVNLGIILE